MSAKKSIKAVPSNTSSDPPSWRVNLQDHPYGIPCYWHTVYMILEDCHACISCVNRLNIAIRSKMRRRFLLITHSDIIDWVRRYSRPVDIDKNTAEGGKKARKRSKTGAPPVQHVHIEDLLLASASTQLATTGSIDLQTTALLVKQFLHRNIIEHRAANPNAPSTGDSAPDFSGRSSGFALHAARSETKKSRKSVSSTRKRVSLDSAADVPSELICDKRTVSVKKRGVPDDPVHKQDEPLDGPDLYIILSGFYDADILPYLTAYKVTIESVFRLECEPCSLVTNANIATVAAPTVPNAAANPDPVAIFWRRLYEVLEESLLLHDLVVIHVPIDTCRVQFAVGDMQASQQVFDMFVPHVFDLTIKRRLYDAYMASLRVIDVPTVDYGEMHAARGAACSPSFPELTRISLVTALLLDGLVERVCELVSSQEVLSSDDSSAEERIRCSTYDADHPTVNQLTESGSCSEGSTLCVNNSSVAESCSLERPYSTHCAISPNPEIIIVYEGNVINEDLWQDERQDLRLKLEHILTQTCELTAFHRFPQPSLSVRNKYERLLHDMCERGGVTSLEHADIAVTSLLFDSLYPVLVGIGDHRPPAPYPHTFLPQRSVLSDIRRLAPECGSTDTSVGTVDSESHQHLDSSQEPVAALPHFASFCVNERLDCVTMAQQLIDARTSGYDLLAGYYFAGGDRLLLVYGHPLVDIERRLCRSWSWCAHTTIGMRDFMEHVRGWSTVCEWLRKKERQLEQAAVAAGAKQLLSRASHGNNSLNDRKTEQQLQSGFPNRSEPISDEFFILPGSLKHEKQMKIMTEYKKVANGKKMVDSHTRDASGVIAMEKSELAHQQSQQQVSFKSANDAKQSDNTDAQCWRRSLSSAVCRAGAQPFAGYNLKSRLLRVTGSTTRQYFDDGSLVSIESCQYVRRERSIRVSIVAGECQLTLHPSTEFSLDRIVVHMQGGYIVQPGVFSRPIVSEPLQQSVLSSCVASDPVVIAADKLAIDGDTPGAASQSSDRLKKKHRRSGTSSGGRRKLVQQNPTSTPLASTADISALPQLSETVAFERHRMLRVSCASGLVLELLPDPDMADDSEPCVRVRQYFVTSSCRRRAVRLVMSDGSLICIPDDDEDGGHDVGTTGGARSMSTCGQLVRVIDPDGGRLEARWCHQRHELVATRFITASGREVVSSSASYETAVGNQLLRRRRRVKMSTDPVTGELFVERDDGVRAVIFDGSHSVTEHNDGTRFSVSFPENDESRVGVNSDQSMCGRVTKVSWLLGMRYKDVSSMKLRPLVCIEHEMYARVTLRQSDGMCEVHTPGPAGLVLRGYPSGSYRVLSPDGNNMQIYRECVCLTGASHSHVSSPVAHVLRLNDLPELTDSMPLTDSDPATKVQHPSVSRANDPKSSVQKSNDTSGAAKLGFETAFKSNTAGASVGGEQMPNTSTPILKNDEIQVNSDGSTGTGRLSSSNVLCESVELNGGNVWRVMADGSILHIPSSPGASTATANMQRPFGANEEQKTPPLPLRLFVMHRDGSGRRLLTTQNEWQHSRYVKQQIGGRVVDESHPSDPCLHLKRSFWQNPFVVSPVDRRWCVPYQMNNRRLLPTNLHCCDVTTLAPASNAASSDQTLVARPTDVIWKLNDKKTVDQSPLFNNFQCSSGRRVVLFREMLVAPPLNVKMRQQLLQVIHAVSVRERTNSDGDMTECSLFSPVHWLERSYSSGELLTFLRTLWLSEDQCVAQRYNLNSANDKLTPGRCQLVSDADQKFLMYRHMIINHRFLPYFARDAGSEFLSHVRNQTPSIPDHWRSFDRQFLYPSIDHRSRKRSVEMCMDCARCTIEPHFVDLGLVLPTASATSRISLTNNSSADVKFNIVRPSNRFALDIQPLAGNIPSGRSVAIHLRLEAAIAVKNIGCRSLFCLLHVRLGHPQCRLRVPVVVAIASGGMSEVLDRISSV